jgi:hypothetical protein
MPVILPTWEAEMGRLWFKVNLDKKVCKTPSQQKKGRCGGKLQSFQQWKGVSRK